MYTCRILHVCVVVAKFLCFDAVMAWTFFIFFFFGPVRICVHLLGSHRIVSEVNACAVFEKCTETPEKKNIRAVEQRRRGTILMDST